MRALPIAVVATFVVAVPAQAPAPTHHELEVPDAPPLPYAVAAPASFTAERFVPLLVCVGDVSPEIVAATVEQAFVVVAAPAREPAALAALLGELRQQFRVEQLGMHLAGVGDDGVAAAVRLAAFASHELQTLTVWGGAWPDDTTELRGLADRRVRLLGDAGGVAAALRKAELDARTVAVDPSDAVAVAQHFAALHAERAPAGAAADVASALDDFHDAAAKGDEQRYFARLPDDAVFLGTDATERWTGAEFRAFALPYFERGPAWTYVPLRRHVTLADGGELAWFDEVLDNEAYGVCRGSGVLERRDERWVVRQYHLTIPIPNALAREVVERIRASGGR